MGELDLFFLTLAGLPALLLFVLLWLRNLKEKGVLQGGWLLGSWNTALFLFLLASALAGGEAWFRFVVDRTDSVGVARLATRWHARHYQLNDQGWRDNVAYDLEKHQARRLTFVGDSFTVGSGIKNVEDRFSNILRARLPDTEIHVLARNGFNTDHHLETIKEVLRWEYQTDAVILTYMMNDVGFCAPDAHIFYKKMRYYDSRLNYLQRESYFLNLLSFRWKMFTDSELGDYVATMKAAYGGSCWEENVATLREILQSLREANIPALVVTFPFVKDLEDYDFVAEHGQLDAFWKAEGVPHLDLLPLFVENAHQGLMVHEWDGHPNELANQLAADAIHTFLADEGVVGTDFAEASP